MDAQETTLKTGCQSLCAGRQDPQALAELLEPWREPLFLFACARLRRYDDAQDVVASTLVKACLKIDSLRQPELLRAWLFAILRNEIRELTRRSSASSVPLPDELGETDSGLAQLDLRLDLGRALAQIPLDQRRSAALFYLRGLSTAEIARELGRPEGTVRRWLHLARQHLAAGMQGYESPETRMKTAFIYTDLDETAARQVERQLRSAGCAEVTRQYSLPSIALPNAASGGTWHVPEPWLGIQLFVLHEWIGGRSALELVPLLKQLGKGDPPRVVVLAAASPPPHAVFAYWSAGADVLLPLPLEADDLERCVRKLCVHLE